MPAETLTYFYVAIIAVLCISESCESVKWLFHSVQRTVTSIYSTLLSLIEVSPHYLTVWPGTFCHFGSLALLSLHAILRAVFTKEQPSKVRN